MARPRLFRLKKGDLFELLICLLLAGLFVLLSSGAAFGQGNVGINNPTPHAKSLLDLTSTDKGLLVPRMTAAQRTAMFPAPDATGKGMLVYQLDGTQGFYCYDGAVWQLMQKGGTGWDLLGNGGTDQNVNFLGTTDAQGLRIRTNGLERMRVAANGNLAIGAATDPVNYRLYVENSSIYPGLLLKNTSATGYSGMHITNDLSTVRVHLGVGNSTSAGWANLGYVGTTTSNPFVLTTNDTERLRIATNGDVGIGTANPALRLHVVDAEPNNGIMNVQNTDATGWSGTNYVSNTGTAWGFVGFNNAAGHAYVGTGTANPLRLYTNGLPRMTVSSAGDVGIGTGTPGVRLDVVGDNGLIPMRVWNTLNNGYAVTQYISSSNLYGHIGWGNPGAGTFPNLFFVGTQAAAPFALTTSDTERMRIAANGMVGIGTTAPTAQLDVSRNSSTGNGQAHLTETEQDFARLGFRNTATTRFWEIAAMPHDDDAQMAMNFYSSANGNLMTLLGTGNLGVGTTAPAAKLEVNGYTKLGSDAPAIRTKKLTGTTAGTQGGFVDIAHGVTGAKILSVEVLIEYATGMFIPVSYSQNPGYEANYLISSTSIRLFNTGANSANILGKPVKVLITYEV